MANIFGEKDTDRFLRHRVKLIKARNKKQPPAIHPKQIFEKTQEFIDQNVNSKKGQAKRLAIINNLLFWALDPDINKFNIDSYKTRSAIVNSLLGVIFQNSLADESTIILKGLRKIVFSRVTYQGSKGEPSPIVHDTIISGVGRVLTAHFNELARLRDEKVDKLTKVKLIKEIQKAKKETGSLAFSADTKQDDEYRHKFPLTQKEASMLLKILKHYQFSAWPDSRDKAVELLNDLESHLGLSLDKILYKKTS